jgi:hypothetical protein
VSRVNSVSIVSGYGLDDRAIEVRSPAKQKDFSSSLCVQTGSGAHPASCTMGTGDPFPVAKRRPGRDADHSPHLMPRSRMSRSYISSPPSASVECSGTVLALAHTLCGQMLIYRTLDVRGTHLPFYAFTVKYHVHILKLKS